MLAKLSVLALAALAPLVSAVGKARVVNKGDDTVYVWSVGSQIAGPYTLNKGGYYSEEFTKDPVTGGKAFKITKTIDGLYTGAPQTIFAYSLDNDKVWYDLSDVFGDAFNGKKLVVASAETTCPSIIWPTGVPPAGSQVKVCTSTQDVKLTIY
ncbi:Bys1 family protein [Chaetomium sp. MPI-SDFR-AT-0129]|uniref:Bys1 family protein n=1 Tax=Dichotomopilus funicola TaxID=1934379 RepID=A0AAN6UU57_9PEZI|nr:Bys1 family protein [Chaetomium sp. MPI-SDFR-AT-0129]KAK4139278.1 putative bys1 family protein [Dichotomopilus funicola]